MAQPIGPAPELRPRRRAAARHARGQAAIHVRRRSWDADKRHAAALLDLVEPAWVVFYGLGSRRFFAMATWPVPRPLIVSAADVEELRDLMREAELTSAVGLAAARDAAQFRLAAVGPGVPIEDISRLVGHRNTIVTETVYRKQIRPVLMQDAKAMDGIFSA